MVWKTPSGPLQITLTQMLKHVSSHTFKTLNKFDTSPWPSSPLPFALPPHLVRDLWHNKSFTLICLSRVHWSLETWAMSHWNDLQHYVEACTQVTLEGPLTPKGCQAKAKVYTLTFEPVHDITNNPPPSWPFWVPNLSLNAPQGIKASRYSKVLQDGVKRRKKIKVKCMKMIRQQWKRDIVDPSTHSFCENGHGATKGTGFPIM
jgi:hypothetical protein